MKCLDEKALSSYLDERLSDVERKNIEEHIADCNICLGMLLVAYESQHCNKKCPSILKDKIKNRLGLKQPKKRPELKWFFAGLFFFVLSFVFRHYFLQFLAISVILGFKWVMEGESAKRVIMIFKGIQEKEKKVERKSSPDVSNISGGDRYGKPE
ncbi:MAG: zf-HC2 domain-containing protein [Candidatus Omnitrophica bacterium]|nr:zf-HC2 domain-containing protein [Candidatus Omnitrophota bacterium]